ncbi:Mrp/NBP35 family ATP-binding protein [Marinithermus hydrothermalis]|uniref:Iron-sulfur cluster carrier protein n=1 Tax=Marinithermus hydrothermalis (strain DSM 14884 / JCM 11576 / T1) TaxID=869210 RepID=F2NP27_MARHT|nr:Mrp/NBP35 family ATP-binding protein [Marinithermus hydrothermalis]AEB11615.1 ATPase-like, ParA/MinD [Marinithermus hydrothermalis DSM 14884]
MSRLSETDVLDALRGVNDPELHKDLVSLGMVEQVVVDGRKVAVKINLTTPACPLKGQIEGEVRAALERIGAEHVEITFGASVRGPQQLPLPGVKNVVAVGSGKGGVGKSTVAVNLAIALSQEGARVGLLDGDIYGPSQARMLGLEGEKLRVNEAKKIVPLERYGIRVLSIANIAPPGQALVWRGPILHGTIRQFLQDVDWGELDYLIVDLPPGTGDVQLSLSQLTQVTGGVIVTTPQDVARIDAERAADMFRKVQVPLLGVIENMAYYACPSCGERSYLFGQGGGRKLAESQNTAFLGEIPLSMPVRESGDAGTPITVAHPDAPEAQAFRQVARQLAGQLSIRNLSTLPMV